MIDTLQIKQMTHIEQIQTMEVLWNELSANAESVESPSWHKELLEATEKRYIDGQETPVDWKVAKQKLKEL